MAPLVARLLLCSLASAGASSGRGGQALASASRERSLEEAWSAVLDADAEAAKNKSPIKRVVKLLQQMKAQLEEEASKESEMYDTMVCWCETNEKEKTTAISDAEAREASLEAEIGTRAANTGKTSTEISQLKAQIAEDTEALKKATAIREKEASEFSGEEKEMVQAMTNLKNAIAVLSRHNGGAASLMQLSSPVFASVQAVLRDVCLKYELMLGDSNFPARQVRRTAAAFLSVGSKQRLHELLLSALNGQEVGEDVLPLDIAEHELALSAKAVGSFVQATGPASYSAQSNGIFGILTQMLDEFEANLSQSQKDEIKAREDFEELSSSKTAQIETAQVKLDNLEEAHAQNQKALSDAKEDIEATRSQRSADVEFLRNLRLTCNDLDKQWEERSASRSAEIKAVSEALAIITEDDARELMTKTVSLLQVTSAESTDQRQRLSQVAAFLRRASQNPDLETDDLLSAWHKRSASTPHAQLATLAVSAELDSFSDVKKMMDKMIADLKEEQQEEVKRKAHCDSELQQTEKATYKKTEEKSDLEAKLDGLASLISRLNEEIAAATQEIKDTEVAIKKASQDREKANAEFQTTVADQRATQAILKKALQRLEQFYKKKDSALLQEAAATRQTPPVQFNDYKKNSGSSSVMGLIEQIVEDSKKLEQEAIASETTSQEDYEEFVKDSNSVIAKLSGAVQTKTKAIASANMDSEDASTDLNNVAAELESLQQYDADLHAQCDFLRKNFQVRQQARLQEIEAIQQAKAILSGSE